MTMYCLVWTKSSVFFLLLDQTLIDTMLPKIDVLRETNAKALVIEMMYLFVP